MAYRVFKKLGWHERTAVTMYVNPWPMRAFLPKAADGLRMSSSAIDRGFSAAADLDGLWSRVRDAYPRRLPADRALISSGATRLEKAAVIGSCARTAGRNASATSFRGWSSRRPTRRRARKALSSTTSWVLGTPTCSPGCLAWRQTRCWMPARSGSPVYRRCRRSSASSVPRASLRWTRRIIGRAFRHNTKWLTYHSKVDPSLVDPSGWALHTRRL